ncbi:MAG: 2-phosphosulfolactate phosphatase [Desulfotomaculaceae bacterium]
MNINLIPVASAAGTEAMSGATAVVFDVLRASSTIVTALSSGYRMVYPVVNVEEAVQIARERGFCLAGERGGQKIPGFPMGNSPLEFSTGPVAGADILVLTTSNGTAAIRKASTAEKVLIGSIINARAVARTAISEGRDIALICAGSDGLYALEDILGAGFVLMEIVATANSVPAMDDQALTALCLARYYQQDPLAGLMEANHGKKLLGLGLKSDLRWCSRLNLYDTVPIFAGNYIKGS